MYLPDFILPSTGYSASSGIIHMLESFTAPSIFPAAQRACTFLTEISHFSAASFTVIYPFITFSFSFTNQFSQFYFIRSYAKCQCFLVPFTHTRFFLLSHKHSIYSINTSVPLHTAIPVHNKTLRFSQGLLYFSILILTVQQNI